VHPAPTFHWDARDELRAFIADRAFATVCATIDGALAVAQVPVLVDGDRLLLHLSRGNPLARALPQRVHVVVAGADAYVSPDWYSDAHQVPTWNYVSVEVAGLLEATDDAGLVDILRKQSAMYESRIPGKTPWTVDKLPPDILAAKLRGIIGATLVIENLRGTRKLSQNKSEADRTGVCSALDDSGRPADREIAALVRALRS
jgi:transcriptional regulator